MTKLLGIALERVSELSEVEQDAVARIIFDELEDEALWCETFARSQEALALLAGEARAESARGDMLPVDPASNPE